MIFLSNVAGAKVLILEPANIMALQSGYALVSPDKSVSVMYTPDAAWLARQITAHAHAGILSSESVDALLEEGKNREPVTARPHHPTQQLIHDGKVVKLP